MGAFRRLGGGVRTCVIMTCTWDFGDAPICPPSPPADSVHPFDRDQVGFDGVHDPVPASAQPDHLSPPERLCRVRIGGQGI